MLQLYIQILICFFFLPFWGNSQVEPNEDDYEDYESTTIDTIYKSGFFTAGEIWYSKKIFLSSFYQQNNTFGAMNFNLPITQVGIGYHGKTCAMYRDYCWKGAFALLFTIPNQIEVKIYNLDVEKVTLTGLDVFFSFAGFDIFEKKNSFDFYLYTGLRLGQYRLVGNPKLQLKNGTFAPFVAFSPAWTFNRIKIGVDFLFDYDISNPNWKKLIFTRKKQLSIDKFRSSGLSSVFYFQIKMSNNIKQIYIRE